MEEFPTPGQVYNPLNTDAFVLPFSLNHIICMKVICFLHSQSSEGCVIILFWCQLPPAYLVIHISSPTCFGGILFVPFVLWSHLCFVSWSWYREGQRWNTLLPVVEASLIWSFSFFTLKMLLFFPRFPWVSRYFYLITGLFINVFLFCLDRMRLPLIIPLFTCKERFSLLIF